MRPSRVTLRSAVLFLVPAVVLVFALAAPGQARADGAAAITAAPATVSSQRFGVDAVAVGGVVYAAGVSARYERQVRTEGLALVRVGWMRGNTVESERPAVDALIANLGYRRYSGAVYLGGELGIAVGRRGRYTDEDDAAVGVKWSASPNLAVAVGAKLGPIDLGIATMVPFFGLGFTLGADFASW